MVKNSVPPAAVAEKLQKSLFAKRTLLERLLAKPQDIKGSTLAKVMRSITKSHAMIRGMDESSKEHVPPKKSQRFLRPTADPLLGVRLSPLWLHLFILTFTEPPLRLAMWFMGFRRCSSCSTSYYYHPGAEGNKEGDDKIPLVFIHGIGVGAIVYLPLIRELQKTGRPIFVPEVPSASAFRPWVMPNVAQSSHQVVASLSTMLTNHGFSQATFSGHSFGSFWLTYMAKYAPGFVAALVFLDPVCFCLHNAKPSRKLVYYVPNPSDISYIVRTDMMVNWAIQRNFSWARGNLFVEDIGKKPSAVFVSSHDLLAPSQLQEAYFREHGATVKSFADVSKEDFERSDLSVTVFQGGGHGEWLTTPWKTSSKIADCIETLAVKAEEMAHVKRTYGRAADRFSLRSSLAVPSFQSDNGRHSALPD